MSKNNTLDKWDAAIALSSGALTAAVSALLGNDIDLRKAHEQGKEQIEKLVIKAAQVFAGYKGTSLLGAVNKLEEYEMLGDKLTNSFGGGLQHHLRDFSHHASPLGLLTSVYMQFTGKGIGTDTDGKIITPEIPCWEKPDLLTGIYNGTVIWFFHMLSDVAGSSSSIADNKEGTGLPGPLLSLIKELSSIPGIQKLSGSFVDKDGKTTDKSNISVFASQLFNGTILGEHDENGKIIKGTELKFDLRTELGIADQALTQGQYIPVLLNEIIVSAFYTVRRIADEIKIKSIDSFEKLKNIDAAKCLPFGNEALTHMRMIANTVFSSVNIASAGIKAALKNKDNKAGFALDFMQGINYCGIITLSASVNSEISVHLQKLHSMFAEMAKKQKAKLIASLPNGQVDFDTAKYAVETGAAIAGIGTPMGFAAASIRVYHQIKQAYAELEAATEERIEIEKECSIRIAVLEDNQAEIEQTVSDYLFRKMTVFANAYTAMDKAISENDIDAFITGNNMIRLEFGKEAMFANQQEFDALMLSKNELTF